MQEPGLLAGDQPARSRVGLLWDVVKSQPSATLGAVVLGTIVVLALLAPVIAPYGLHEQVGPVYGRPSWSHPLVVGFAATLVSILIGGTVGLLAGYFGKATDTVLMRITDYFLAIPDVPLMIVVAAIWGPSLFHIIVVIGVLLWTGTARVVRAQVKSVRERAYVKRARSLGAGNLRIVLRHVLPQIAPLLIANTVLTIAVAVFDETALSFLGLGDPSRISLGKVIENAFQRTAISSGAWWAIVPPGAAVALLILSCSLLGRAMEDALNPRLKVAHLSAKGFRLRPLVGRDKEAL
jgi:peptide/nickel transport system permease protein